MAPAPGEGATVALCALSAKGNAPTGASSPNDAAAVPVSGVRDFSGQRLHVLQIGLGTFGTFADLLDPDSDRTVTWLLEACSDASASLRAVGVEPVFEHVAKIQPALQSLPNAALVQAAVGREAEQVAIYALRQESYERCLREVDPDQRKALDASVLFLRNMSCVGQPHPDFKLHNEAMRERFGVEVEMEPIRAHVLTYGALSRLLRFTGVEVLVIDAEGHDCRILRSLIDHCAQQPEDIDDCPWPDVIQFESMGTCDEVDGAGSEEDTLRSLEAHGYVVASVGKDTTAVRRAALAEDGENAVQRWVASFCCGKCGRRGVDAMPFAYAYPVGCLCAGCSEVISAAPAWLLRYVGRWRYIQSRVKMRSIATDGASLWALDGRQELWRWVRRQRRWERLGTHLAQVAVASGGREAWGVQTGGQVVRLDASRVGQARLSVVSGGQLMQQVAISADGLVVLGLDPTGGLHVFVAAAGSGGGRWRALPGGPPGLRQISVSNAGYDVWAVDEADAVFHCWDVAGDCVWTEMGGWLRRVAVSADGFNVWGVNSDRQVYYRRGVYGSWVQLNGTAVDLCVASANQCVWGLDSYGKVWCCRSR